jgi:hypothetical protein
MGFIRKEKVSRIMGMVYQIGVYQYTTQEIPLPKEAEFLLMVNGWHKANLITDETGVTFSVWRRAV